MEAAGCPEPTGPAQTQTVRLESEPAPSPHAPRPLSPTRPYVVVFEEAEHPQLSEDSLTGDQVLEDIGHLLQGHLAAVAWIRDGPARVRVSRLADWNISLRCRTDLSRIISVWVFAAEASLTAAEGTYWNFRDQLADKQASDCVQSDCGNLGQTCPLLFGPERKTYCVRTERVQS